MDREQKRPEGPILITAGDPAGVGPELLHSLVAEYRASGPSILIFHTNPSQKLVESYENASGRDVLRLQYEDFERNEALARAMNSPGQVAIIEPDGDAVEIGNPSPEGGRRAFVALSTACDWILDHGCGGLLTAPLSKEHVHLSGQTGFSGHTGYLAERFQARPVMLMHGKGFSVLPLTVHIPLRQVPEELAQVVLDDHLIEQIAWIMERPAYQNGKIALCGLNPHSGEGGLLGTEEQDFLHAFAGRLRNRNLPVEGPLSADGLFVDHVRRQYRLILACYHDQGLIPFKSLEGMDGINVSVGLPFLRTSPDHGTAFSLAGKNQAHAGSMIRAYRALISGEL